MEQSTPTSRKRSVKVKEITPKEQAWLSSNNLTATHRIMQTNPGNRSITFTGYGLIFPDSALRKIRKIRNK